MRTSHSRRLAALELRPAPVPPSASAMAFYDFLEELLVSHAARVKPELMEALDAALLSGSSSNIAVATVDFMEEIERVDPAAAAKLNRLLDSAE